MWARCMVEAIGATTKCNLEYGWRQLLSLTKMVLRAAVRGGAKNKKRGANETRIRCERWLAGERETLWEPVPPRTKRKAKTGDTRTDTIADLEFESKEKALVAFCREGLYVKACGVLGNEPPAEITPAILQSMKDLHPPNPNP